MKKRALGRAFFMIQPLARADWPAGSSMRAKRCAAEAALSRRKARPAWSTDIQLKIKQLIFIKQRENSQNYE